MKSSKLGEDGKIFVGPHSYKLGLHVKDQIIFCSVSVILSHN